MTDAFSYQVYPGAPHAAEVVSSMLASLKAYDEAWFKQQTIPAEPVLADVEHLLDTYSKHEAKPEDKDEPTILDKIAAMDWETMEWMEAPEDLYFAAVGRLELIALAQWRDQHAAEGESWDDSRRRRGDPNAIGVAA